MTGSVIGVVIAVFVVVFLAKLALRRAGRSVTKVYVTYPQFPPPQIVPPFVAQTMPPPQMMELNNEAADRPARPHGPHDPFDDIVRDFYNR